MISFKNGLTGLFLALAGMLSAQSDLMLYNFNGVAQSTHLNPAMPQQSKLWIGLPVMSGYNIAYHNNSFSLIDVFEAGTNINDNLARVTNQLDEQSHLAINSTIDLFGLGFQTKKGFFTLGAQQVVDFRMDMPRELFQLLFSDGQTLTNFALTDFDLEAIVRTNYYVGYQQRLLNDRLTLGGRFKYIFGQTHGYTERVFLKLENTDNFTLRATTDILARRAGANDFNFNNINAVQAAFSGNQGYAFDFGLHFKLNDHWEFSGSMIDWGSIDWNEFANESTSKGQYDFEGIKTNLDRDNLDQSIQNTQDSLEAAFNFQDTAIAGYNRSLMSRAFLSTTYHLSEKHALGAIYHHRNWNGQLYHDFGVNYVGRWARGFQFTAGYSIIDGTYGNVGLGMSFKTGPVQLYLMTENVVGAVAFTELYSTNLRIGINLTFYGDKEEEEEDVYIPDPFFDEEEEKE